MFALIDCNNFYASCERVFNPKLVGRPLVVLSNNDGCVIARSKEARKLGIPMGAPAFKWRDHFTRHNVETLSSNFTLYGDMSARVFDVLATFGLPIEIYSIDEAFLLLEGAIDPQLIRDKVYRWTGIPTSVGVAKTKTLAKVAAHIAKSQGLDTFTIDDPTLHLRELPVNEIWGIGARLTKKLASLRVHTAFELVNQSDTWIKKHLTISGLQTVYELRGTPCFNLDDTPERRKSIVSSRTFSSEIADRIELERALSAMVTRAGEKLRLEGVQAAHLTLFLATNPFSKDPYRSFSQSITLPHPSSDTPYLITQTKRLLDQAHSPTLSYKRGGVLLSDFNEGDAPQLDMLDSDPNRASLMHVLDHINAKYGPLALHSAAIHPQPKRAQTVSFHSPQYTTAWNDIVKIRI